MPLPGTAPTHGTQPGEGLHSFVFLSRVSGLPISGPGCQKPFHNRPSKGLYSASNQWWDRPPPPVHEAGERGSSEADREDTGGQSARATTVPKEVCIIIPALNEATTIGRVIRRISRESPRILGYTPRVLVVDGSSVDATLRIAKSRGAEIVVQAGKGKGNALRQVCDYLQDDEWHGGGLMREPRHYVGLDADCTYPPETIADLIAALDSGYDVVLASRFMGMIHPGAMTELNRFGNRALTQLFGFLNGVDLSDVCTGMYAFNERVFRNLKLQADRFDVEAELFTFAHMMNALFAEVPFDYSRRVGKPKLRPLRAGIQIGIRMFVGRTRRPEGSAALPESGPPAPHPFIAWLGTLRDPSVPRRSGAPLSRSILNQFLALVGRSEAPGSERDWIRRI